MVRYRPSLHSSTVVTALFFVFVLIIAASDATLVVHLQNGTSLQFPSVAIKYAGNSLSFQNITGSVGAIHATYPAEAQPTILMMLSRGWKHPYFEDILVQEKTRIGNITAVVVYSDERYQLGFMQYAWTGSNAGAEVVFPVVNVDVSAWDVISREMSNTSSNVLVTITDEGVNPWMEFRENSGRWWYIFFVVSICGWNLGNIVLSVYLLHGLGLRRSISTLCIGLSILTSIQRIIFAIDPLRGWLLPFSWQTLFISWYASGTFSALVLLVFYWQDAIDTTSLKISSVLTRSKYPASVAVFLLFAVDISTSSLRITYALGARSQSISVLISAGFYVVIAGVAVLWYIFVTYKVMRFLRTLPMLNKKQKQLKLITIRAISSLGGIVVSLIAAIIIVMPIYFTPVGFTVGHYLMAAGSSWMSTTTITAFQKPKKKGSKTVVTDPTGSAEPAQSGRSKSSNASGSV